MPGARRVRRGGRGGVPGRRADDGLGAVLDRLRDRHRHAAVLERARRVRALDLQQHAADAGTRRDPGRLDQRRVALEERDDRGVGPDRQELAVRLDEPGPPPARRPRQSSSPMTRTTEPTRLTASTSRSASSVARRSASRARWVMNTSRASAPMPRCSIDLIETPWRPNSPAIDASTPGRSAASINR